jgi:hypothetical protein
MTGSAKSGDKLRNLTLVPDFTPFNPGYRLSPGAAA